MAKIKLQPEASSSNVFTIATPAGSGDYTINLPAATGTLLTTDGDGSSLTGTGSPSITDNGNATAITINSTEDVKFHHNFTSASDGAVNGEWRSDWAGLQVGTTSAHYLALRAGNTEQLRITTDGRGDSQFTARMWCNLNGTGTIAIRDSHNVSSISDGGTGFFTVYIDVDMDNANHVHFVSAQEDDSGDFGGDIHYFGGLRRTPRATGGVDLSCQQGMTSPVDPLYLMVVVFGD